MYKAFCWRFWQLLRDGGSVGVVLPRSALSAAGSASWREAILDGGCFEDVTLLLNNRQWVFPQVHPQWTIALVTLRKGAAFQGQIRLHGPYPSRERYDAEHDGPGVSFAAADFRTWSDGASFPLLPTPRSAEIFVKLRSHPRLDHTSAEPDDWKARPATEFHATNDRNFWTTDEQPGTWPVMKGASFNIWENDTGVRFGYANPGAARAGLQERRLRQNQLARSPFSAFPRSWAEDPETLPCLRPRIVFRDVARATDSRTIITALAPGQAFLTNKAPYLLFSSGDESDQAFVVGVLSSIPLDWYARRVVELSVNFHIFNGLPIPRPERDHPLRQRIIALAGRLAASDDRFAEWAQLVGVDFGPFEPTAKADLVGELDAAVALLFGLSRDELEHVFETFHAGWNPTERVALTLAHYDRLAS
jgi:hypothetical protein